LYFFLAPHFADSKKMPITAEIRNNALEVVESDKNLKYNNMVLMMQVKLIKLSV